MARARRTARKAKSNKQQLGKQAGPMTTMDTDQMPEGT